jgi:transcriptional regulator with XRE-family HTH domain
MSDYFDARSVGARLAEERQRLGFTKVSLGEALGVRREMVGRYEAGTASPGAEVLSGLMRLGVDLAYILTGTRTHAYSSGASEPQALADASPLARKKAKLHIMIEQIEDESAADRVQEDLENFQRIRQLERKVAELEKKAG